MTVFDISTIGETMLRMNPPRGQRLVDAQNLAVHVGGAESNVAAALAQLGRQCLWVSQLPDGPLGRIVLDNLRRFGVDTSGVRISRGGRLGIYFLDDGAGPLPPRVTYDRANSAFTALTSRDIDWTTFLDTRIVHMTGITAALGSAPLEIAQEALRSGRSAGLITSLDINYRQRLWTPTEARKAFKTLLPFTNVLFCSVRDAEVVFGLEGDTRQTLQQLHDETGIERIVMSQGPDGVMAWDKGTILHTDTPPVEVVSRPGAGDALAAGVLDGLLDDNFHRGLLQGAALASLALGQRGDMVVVDRAELDTVLDRATALIDR